MENYKSNSDASLNREEHPNEVEKRDSVVSSPGQTKKKSFLSSLKGEIISDESTTIGSYVVHDVLIPSFKRTIVDIVCMIFGDNRGGRRPSNSTNASRVSYSGYYEDRNATYAKASSNSRFDYDEIVYATRGDAEVVIKSMFDLVDTYGRVTVNDLYDLSGISTSNYQTTKYGWTNLGNPEAKSTYNGWIIAYLPKPRPI